LQKGLNIFIVAVLLIVNSSVIAQSDNYWSWNFNTHSALLAGSVVAGSAGPSAIFYNPALIDHENMPTLSLSANIISLQFFDVENIAGDGIDANRVLFKVQPRFLSYDLANKNDRLGVEVAILSPISEEIKYTIQHFDELDIIHRTLGMETYTGYLNYSRKYDDIWVGGGFSYRISERFYVGGSAFLSVKVLKYESSQIAQAYHDGDSVIVNEIMEPRYISQSSFEEEMKYWYLSFIFKAGLQYKFKNDRVSLGLNFTFPDIPLYGEADVRKTINRSNVYNNNGNTFTSNESTIGVEEDLNTVKVKNPFSVAIGAQYNSKNRKNSILLSLEYFHKIDPYPVVKSSLQTEWLPDYISENITDGDFMSYYFESRSVTNIGIGFRQYISPSLVFLGGFRTDFTAGDIENDRYVANKFSINQIHMNKYHLTSGLVLRIKNVKVISGLQYTRGRSSNMTQVINYSDPVEYNSITQQALEGKRNDNAHAIYNEIALFLGMSVDL
jgi:hypothetical protein